MSDNILPKAQRLDLAVARKLQSPTRSITQIAHIYNIPRTTLQHRLNGRQSRTESHQKHQRLSNEEEESIVHWIEKAISWNWNPRIAHLEQYATHLLRARNDFKPLGVRWYTQFLNRHPEFKLKYSRSLNQDRIDITDYGVIERWFNLFNEMRQKYGVVNNDIYNMDEKAIAQGLIENAKIIVRRHDLK